MFHLLTSPRTARTVRAMIGSLVESAADTLRSLAPAGQADAEVVEAPDPADVLDADELPPVEQIETAAREYERAADQARRADRGKRAAKKILDKLPAGLYGTWRVFRTPSSRQTPDLAAITATYKKLGLGPVPMKECAPSLKVERVEVLAGIETLTAVAA
ncbi:hypothetical protein OH768_44065 [Streptomyces sp. NBC_01622]|uniref:hypothetical protein n=1 Tax=Streptomyces sp. NBC_01622 TaxID=2975903 RepID=UPI0038639C85|nr:hypothetical protein OH768_44065 [Streptomyces sp. NBC_01622]